MKLFFIVFTALAFFQAQYTVADNTTLLQQGQLVYTLGQMPGGASLQSTAPKLVGAQAACVNCHRASGMGGSEGTSRVAPITARDLFSAPGKDRPLVTGEATPRVVLDGMQAVTPRRLSRAAYDDESLKRAIRLGVDASGNALNPLMPRYGKLDENALNALVAYMRQLGSPPTPGLTADTLHIATVITPDASAHKQRAVLGVLRAWAGQRPRVALHEWQLAGERATWASQLDVLSQKQPVFAVLSGTGGSDWSVVDQYCQRTATPCIFPLVDVVVDPVYWSLHFSQGLLLEARVLAQHMGSMARAKGARIVQLHDDAAGEMAAREMNNLLAGDSVETVAIQPDTASDAFTATVSTLRASDVLVVWGSNASLQKTIAALPAPDHKNGLPSIFLSASRLMPESATLPLALRKNTQFVSYYLEPRALRSRTALGFLPWARQAKLEVFDEQTQAEVYAAASFFGDALTRMQGRLSREFLLETLEGAVNNRAIAGPYQQLSLGPGQRLASKGGNILGYGAPDQLQLAPVSPRIVPTVPSGPQRE